MKVLSKLKDEPGIWMTTLPIPKINNNNTLVKVRKTAICGTDFHIYMWNGWTKKTISTPMTIGPEFVVEIVEIHNKIPGLKIGDRVSGEGHITCGYCRNCRTSKGHLSPNTKGLDINRQGAFAEYLRIPATNIFKVPQCINDDIACIFDLFGNAVHRALSFDLIREGVLITGTNPIGIMAVAIACHIGAHKIVIADINKYRLTLAKIMGS